MSELLRCRGSACLEHTVLSDSLLVLLLRIGNLVLLLLVQAHRWGELVHPNRVVSLVKVGPIGHLASERGGHQVG